MLRMNSRKSLQRLQRRIHEDIQVRGFNQLMRGITPALLKMVPNAAASFYTYETLKDQYLQEKGKKDLDTWASLTIGGAAAAVGTALTYPLEVARREISLSALPKGAVHVGRNLQYQNVLQALKGIVQHEASVLFIVACR